MLKNILVYIILLGCSGAAAYYFNDRLGYTPLLFLVFLAVLDLICAFIARLSLKIEPQPKVREFTRGDKAKITFTFANRGPLIISHAKAWMWFCGENLERPYAAACTFTLLPRSSDKNDNVDFYVTLSHVGVFKSEIKRIRVYGLLGLFGFSYRQGQVQSIWVLPKISGKTGGGVVDTVISAEGKSSSQTEAIAQNPDCYSGVREYEPGDPMHSIHWKLTAHRSKYMTRLYESDDSGSLTIVVDLTPAPCERQQRLCVNDKLVETALSAVSECVKCGARVKLIFSDGGVFHILHVESPADIPEIAARLVTANATLSTIFDFDDVSGGGSAVYITANTDMTIAILLAELKSAGENISLVYTKAPEFDTEESRRFFEFLDRHDVDFRVIESEKAPQSRKSHRRSRRTKNRN